MTNNIDLPKGLRIRDFDHNQYVIEKEHKTPKGVSWVQLSYHGTVKGIAARARELVAYEYEKEARQVAYADFEFVGAPGLIAALPKKPTETTE